VSTGLWLSTDGVAATVARAAGAAPEAVAQKAASESVSSDNPLDTAPPENQQTLW